MSESTDKPITTVSEDGKMITTQFPYHSPSLVDSLLERYNEMNTPTDTLTDREQDALVAEKIMGLEVRQYNKYYTVSREESRYETVELPHYTTNAFADYQVLCKVRDTWGIEQQGTFRDAVLELYRTHNRLSEDEQMLFPEIQYQVGDYSKAALKASGGKK